METRSQFSLLIQKPTKNSWYSLVQQFQILQFGAKQATSTQSKHLGLSEELKDEQINKLLQEALTLKQAQNLLEARHIYQAVLSDDYLMDSKINKHMYMKFNAYRNLGDIQNKLKDPEQAKSCFTNALKIHGKDPVIWSSLGYIEYEYFKNNSLAKQCFEISIAGIKMEDQRSLIITPVLQKLAEIYFYEYNFRKTEEIVDSIIQRFRFIDFSQSAPVPLSEQYCNTYKPIALFAHLLKSYFLAMKGPSEKENSVNFLEKARELNSEAKWEDLSVLKRTKMQLDIALATKDLVALTSYKDRQYQELKINTQQMRIVLCPSSINASLSETIDDFLSQLVKNCVLHKSSTLQYCLIDCSAFIAFLEHQQTNNIESLSLYDQMLKQEEKSLESNGQMPQNPNQSNQAQIASNNSKKAKGNQRVLRNKDGLEQQIKTCNVNALKEFKEYFIQQAEKESHYTNKLEQNNVLEFIFGQKEILNGVKFFEDQSTKLNNDSENQSLQEGTQKTHIESQFTLAQNITENDFQLFLTCLKQLNNQGYLFIVRQLLRRFILQEPLPFRSNSNFTLNYKTGCYLYQLALTLLYHDEQKVFQFEQVKNWQILITLFEIALFNKKVRVECKSGPTNNQQSQFHHYLTENIQSIFYDLALMKAKEPLLAEELRNRYCYSIMHYNFEHLTNMVTAITYYNQLDLQFFNSVGFIWLPWVSTTFNLNAQNIQQFGKFKIKQAQIVKNFDEDLTEFKQQELLERQEESKKGYIPTKNKDRRNEYSVIAAFYFDQVCSQLQKMCHDDNYSQQYVNESPLKKNWEKLMFCLQRCQVQLQFKLSMYLFSIFTSFQFNQKKAYEFCLQKLIDFEPLFNNISEKLKDQFQSIMNEVKFKPETWSLLKIRELAFQILQKAFQVEEKEVPLYITKLEAQLLRIFNSEFMYFCLIKNGVQSGSQNFQLIYYMKCLFYLQALLMLIKLNESQTLSEQIKPLLNLLNHLDKLGYSNLNSCGDLFVRPYINLVSLAFPFFLQLQCLQVRLDQSLFSTENELLKIVMHLTNFFFDSKFDEDELLTSIHTEDQKMENEEEAKGEGLNNDKDEDTEEESLTDKLQLLDHIKQKQSKGTSNAKNQGYQVLSLFFASYGLDIYLASDLLFICNYILGNRLANCGEMTPSDIDQISTITSNIVAFLLAQQNTLRSKCPSLKAFNENLRRNNKLNPLCLKEFLSQDQQCFCTCQNDCFREENLFCDQVVQVSLMITNIYSHIVLSSSPFENISLKAKKRDTLAQAIGQNEEDILDNMGIICNLGLHFSKYQSVELNYLKGIIEAERFKISSNCKLIMNYSIIKEYQKYKDYYYFSIFNSLRGLVLINQSLGLQNQKQRSTFPKSNQSLVNKVKKLMESILTITLKKESYLSYVLRFKDKNQQESDQKCPPAQRADKLKNFRYFLLLLSQICEKLDQIEVIQADSSYNLEGDPRIAKDKRRTFNDSIKVIVETFTGFMEKSIVLREQRMAKFILDHENSLDCLFMIKNYWGNYPIQASHNEKLCFYYPFVSAYATKKIKKTQIKMNFFEYVQDTSNHFEILKRSLLIASAGGLNISGGLEVLVKSIRETLKLLFYLKYESQTHSREEDSKIKQFIQIDFKYRDLSEGLVKLILEKSIFKGMCFLLKHVQSEKIEESKEYFEDDQSENEMRVFIEEPTSVNKARVKIFAPTASQIPEFNVYENYLSQIYQIGSQIALTLEMSQKLWPKLKLQTMLVKSLIEEIAFKKQYDSDFKEKKEHFTQIGTILKAFTFSLSKLEEDKSFFESQVSYFPEETMKCPAVYFCNSEPLTSQIRLALKTLTCNSFFKAHKYQPIKEIYKLYFQAYKSKSFDAFQQQKQKVVELKQKESYFLLEYCHMLFLTKDMYMSTICVQIENQLHLYMNLRKNYISNRDPKIQQALIQFKNSHAITSEFLPPLLKDIFDLLIETHQRKGVLISRNLVSEGQKKNIRQAVLNACAVCGSDPELDFALSQKPSSKFLDFAKLTQDDYSYEGLMISLKWFHQLLEGRGKKEQDFMRRLKITTEDIEKEEKSKGMVLSGGQMMMINNANENMLMNFSEMGQPSFPQQVFLRQNLLLPPHSHQ